MNNNTLTNSLLIVDDHKMIINGLISLLSDKFQTIETAFNGKEAVQVAESLQPELVILDYRLPDTYGYLVAKEIKEMNRDIKILAYTYNDDAEAVNNMFSANVNGYVLKDDKDEEVLMALDYIMQGKDYYCPVAKTHILNNYTLSDANPTLKVGDIEFSPREIEVIRMTCMRMTAKQIGKQIGLSERTVEQYKSSVNKKIGSKNLVGLIKFALKNNIVKLEDI